MDIGSLLQEIVGEVKRVPGVKAMVLGGSRARGTHTVSSDIDLGIYYEPQQPLDVAALAKVATQLDDGQQPDPVTAIGGWGPWINGGGWLRVRTIPVDFLYRDLDQVGEVMEACLHGRVEIFYQPGHPFGFTPSIYLGEIAICQPLWDPHGLIAALKNRVFPYPVPLQKAVIERFAWEIDFSIGIAVKSIERKDVVYAAGCCFRSILCMLQVLFAINREYWLNEKGAVAIANHFEIKPANFQGRINQVFGLLEATPEAMSASIGLLTELSADINGISKGLS